jgi:hypothetical protein
MKTTVTKFFLFSCSFPKDGKVWGRNFRLGLTAHVMDEKIEEVFVRTVEEKLIRRIESKDLVLHVDFLKEWDLTDLGLLRAFKTFLKSEIVPVTLKALSLERDENTLTVLTEDENH